MIPPEDIYDYGAQPDEPDIPEQKDERTPGPPFPELQEKLDIDIRTTDGLTTYSVNGAEYDSLAKVPPAARRVIEEIHKKRDMSDGFIIDGPPVYEINGVTYDSLDDVPGEMRDLIADALETAGGGPSQVNSTKEETFERVFLDGKEYASLDELPPHLRNQLANLETSPSTTIEYITENGVTRKFVDGREVPIRPGGESAAGGPAGTINVSRHGPVHLGESQARTYRKIVASRPLSTGKGPYRGGESSPYRIKADSRSAAGGLLGQALTTISYIVLILWSQLMPASWGSYLFTSFLIGDVGSKILFGHWGYTEEVIKPGLKGFAVQAIGVLFFMILLVREGAFEGPLETKGAAVALVATLSVVVMFLKLAGLVLKRMANL